MVHVIISYIISFKISNDMCHKWSRNCLSFSRSYTGYTSEALTSLPYILVEFKLLNLCFLCIVFKNKLISLSFSFLVFVLPVLQFTASDYAFGNLKLFLHTKTNWIYLTLITFYFDLRILNNNDNNNHNNNQNFFLIRLSMLQIVVNKHYLMFSWQVEF